MKRALLALSCLILAGSFSVAQADDIRHTFAGDDRNSFYIDDAGGSVDNGGNDLSYYLNLLDVDQSAIGTLLLYGADGIGTPVVDNGFAGYGSSSDFGAGSGIALFPLEDLPGASAPGEIGLVSLTPPVPVSYVGSETGLRVEQVSYTSDAAGDRFVIVEYRVVNESNGAVVARIGLSNDFDVDLKSADARVGYDVSTGLPTVFQQEHAPVDPNHTTVGVSLIRGTLAQYRLEVCSGAFGSCQILGPDDLIRRAFFEGASGQVNDLTAGVPNQDFAVTIAADLGSIPPGEGRGAVFCYNLGGGNSPEDGLDDCLLSAQNCEEFYEENIAVCGNGLVNFGEGCDDGNDSTNDACPSGPDGSCQPARCGDGFIWDTDGGNEACDDGNDSTNDACPSGPEGNCQPATCGDGFVWNTDGGNEECDDGNDDNNDLCTNACQFARCGDGFHQPANGEECDDGNDDNNDLCTNDCQLARCGDGFTQPANGEECDDGNDNNNDLCTNDCQHASCGDGFLQPGEQCDDGNTANGDGCSNTCQLENPNLCGNGVLNPGETCDDGNTANGDGCNEFCQIEPDFPGGPGGPGDPNGGSTNPPGNVPVCGNGIVEEGELCDDGNDDENDLCSSSCFPLPVLQGGGTSSNSPLGRGGCSLQAANSPAGSLGFFGLLGLAFAGSLRLRKKAQ